MIIELHQSWLEEYMLCPERARQQWFNEVVDGPTDATAIGTALHAGAEAYLTRRAAHVEDAYGFARSAFEVEMLDPDFKWIQVKKLETAMRRVDQALDNWFEGIYPQLGQPLIIEQEFRLPLGEFHGQDGHTHEVWLAGTIDFGDDTGLWDWKTGKDGLKKYEGGRFGEGWKLKRWGLQPIIYCWAARQLELVPEPNVFNFAAVAKDAWQIRVLPVERSSDDDLWLAQLTQNVVNMLTSQMAEWPKNDHHALCSPVWCPAWGTCKGATSVKTPTRRMT